MPTKQGRPLSKAAAALFAAERALIGNDGVVLAMFILDETETDARLHA